jgi:DNA-directed RNA polymerase II subunit RPB1
MKSTIQPSKIIGIQFSIGSPEEIRKNSVVEVTTRDTYINNKPVMGGLFDPKMGVLEPGLICPTDGLTYINTPGYFGHIEMARPVIFIQHLKDIMKILKCVCFKCSRLLLNKKQHTHVLKMSMDARWDYVSKLAIAIKRCGESTEDGCGCKQPSKIKLEGMSTIYATWERIESVVVNMRGDVNMHLTPEIILKIFRRISDEDIAFMGFSPIWSRPEWMICQVLPVPPPAVRPSVKHDAQQRSEDDLTHIYSNIIKTNRDLLEKIQNNAPANVIEGLSSVLQYFVAMIVNNKVKGAVPMAQRSGRPLQCISGRLNSKNGRVRGNLMGKRVDFSARSVITGDPNLSIRQLGVPLKVAKNITKPVSVNDLNRDFLLALVRNGPDEYPGAKILERKNGESISLRYVDRGSIRLEVGDVVHRHMMDGDAVLFNRQPSLHRNSMMCHIVKVMKVGDTFRINVGVTKPYNADFDGDEMNMHMPQNVLAETELRHLAAIPYQLISPTSNSPIIGIYQDSMLGSFQFTRERVSFTPKEAMNLLMMYPDVDVSALRKKAVSSFEVLSQIFPPVTMVYKNKLFKDAEEFATSNNVFELRNGQYMRGRIDKSVLGSSTKGVIHRVFNDYGNMAAANFIDNLQNIITEYMKTSSFSVGISDLIANKITQERIVQVIADKKMEVQSIINQVHMGVFENSTANTNAVEFETRVNNILNKATEQSGKIGRENLGADNRFVMIVDSGSKGSPINISQMISCLGQQNVDGKRIPYGFNDRTLPHFAKFDDSPIARGFIEDSYITGLTAPGLFFHAMGGRIGLIDTAVKTSKTGYIQRRLIKGMEYYQVYYDMTVRNDKGYIVQFAYGDDGVDSTKVENQTIPLVGMSLEDIYMHYDIPGLNERDADLLVIYNKSTITRMRKQREETRLICQIHIANMQDYQRAIVEDLFKNRDDNVVRVPVAFQNIIANIQGQFHLNAGSIVDITPKEAFELIETYFLNLQKLHYAKPTKMFEILYYFYLSPKDLLVNRRFHQKALVFLLETICLKYKQAIVSPGENVGVIAGQSIGEPTTQLTLNTFHLAGVATKSNVTRGVPRIEEILRLTKNPSSTSMTVYLKPVDEFDKDRAEKYSNMIEHTKLKDVVKSVQIFFDPNERSTFIQEDQTLLDQFYEFEDFVKECNDSGEDYDTAPSISGGGGRAPTAAPVQENTKSKWIVRMEMDAEQLLDKNITMDDIHFALVNSHKSEISCVYSDYNSDKLVFRIRMNAVQNNTAKKNKPVALTLDQSDKIHLLQSFQDSLLNNIVLRGISGINNVMPRKLQNNVVKEDGRYVKKESWILDTNGSNLMDVLALDYIDNTRTFSNDIKEMFDIFGIEAARQAIFNEFTEVMEFSDVYINYHHLSLLCDRMTSTKDLVPIFRSGILNDNIGPIAKATFEVHTEVFLDAARHADFDAMRGVSANVMCGQYGNYGTGSFGVVLDMKTMGELSDAMVDVSDDVDKIDEMFGAMSLESKGECSKAQIEIKNYLSSIKKEDLGICEDDYDMGF